LPRKSKKSKTKAEREEQSENRLFYLVLMLVVGPAIIISSLGTGYYYGALLGLALEAWGIWETPEIHPYLKLIINWKSRKQTIQFKDSPVKDSNVVSNIQAQRDVNIFQVSPKKESAQDALQPKIVTGIRVGFERTLYGGEVSEPLVFLEAANQGAVPVMVPSISSLKVLMPNDKVMTPLSDTWESDREFPFELGPGRAYSIWRSMRGFAASMKKNGYSGKVNLVVTLWDEAHREFKSGPIVLDLDSWTKGLKTSNLL
jgi:hypothetical protein